MKKSAECGIYVSKERECGIKTPPPQPVITPHHSQVFILGTDLFGILGLPQTQAIMSDTDIIMKEKFSSHNLLFVIEGFPVKRV